MMYSTSRKSLSDLSFTSEIVQTNPVMLVYVQIFNHLGQASVISSQLLFPFKWKEVLLDPTLPTCVLSHSFSIHCALTLCQAPCLMLVIITNQRHSLQFRDLISYQFSFLLIQPLFPSMLPSVFTPTEIHNEWLLCLTTLSLDICMVISLTSIKSSLKCHIL